MKFTVVNRPRNMNGLTPKAIVADPSTLPDEKWVEIKSRRFRDQWHQPHGIMRAFRLRLNRELSILLREILDSGEYKVVARVVYAHNKNMKVSMWHSEAGQPWAYDWSSLYKVLCEKDPIDDHQLFCVPCGDWYDIDAV